jgi:phosphoadenosine phosphosulfate reductase
MHVTMVKKRLKNGEPCQKCAQAEDLLKTRGLWSQVDDVIWAEEGNPDSAGMQLAARHGVELAPFFIVRDGDDQKIFTSTLKLVKELAPAAADVASKPAGEIDVPSLALEYDTKDPSAILRWGLERFGQDCAIAFSGAEDVMLIDMAVKSGLPFSVFSLDTGRLHPETYAFFEKVRAHYGIEIELVNPDPTLLEPFVKKKGLFSFYEEGHKECCGIRKVQPLKRTLAKYRAWVTGQRKDQSPTRAEVAVLQVDSAFSGKSGELLKLNPLANQTLADVWRYIRGNSVPYNSLHDRGFVSIGCEPCTRPPRPGEHERAGRWWWEEETQRECGLHVAQKR